MAAPMDTDPPTLPPLKVWVMSMNRHVTTDEIVRGLNKIEDEDVRKTCLNKPTRDECIRSMISKLYPIIVMQHKLSRYRFKRAKSSSGKEYFIPIMCWDTRLRTPDPLLAWHGPLVPLRRSSTLVSMS